MSLLTDFFMRGVDLVSNLGPPPFQAKVTFDAMWLGEIEDDLFTVEIKDPSGELGWLYGKCGIVAYSKGIQTLAIRRTDLQAIAEQVLKEKKFITDGNPLEHGKLKRIEKSIVGFIHIDHLRKYISQI